MKRFLLALAFTLVTTSAWATPEFPGAIVGDLKITCSNPIWDGQGCMICHTSNSGGIGTVQHPFGAALKAQGLSAFADSELSTLLTKEQGAMHDYNCDGIPDIEELTTCQWQMLSMTGTACGGDGGAADAGPPIDNVIYGCDAAPRSTHASSVPPAIAALLVGALLASRARKRR